MARSDLGPRVVVALVGIPVVLGAIYLGGWVLGVLLAGAAALASREFYRLAEVRGVRPFTGVGVAASAAVVLLATAHPTPAGAAPLVAGALVLVALVCMGAAVWLRWPGEPMASVSITVAGVVYVGVSLAFAPLLRALPETTPGAGSVGPWVATSFLLLPLLTTWVGDTSAYFVGRAWGRRKLAPAASPGKSVEGAVAGLVGSSLTGALVAALALSRVPEIGLSVVAAAGVGLVLGAVAQVGDLAESVLKREAGVKDSGHILPGHGGMLDRVDALLTAIPAAWFLLALARVLG